MPVASLAVAPPDVANPCEEGAAALKEVPGATLELLSWGIVVVLNGGLAPWLVLAGVSERLSGFDARFVRVPGDALPKIAAPPARASSTSTAAATLSTRCVRSILLTV